MNYLQYKILNYLYQETDCQRIDIQKFCKEQYERLKIFSGQEQERFTLTKEEFEIIITQIYEVLKLTVTEEEWDMIIEEYLYQLTADCLFQDEKLNLEWCLDKLYYLSLFMPKDIAEMYDNDIAYIQKQLYKKFQISESIPKKCMRKLKTQCLSKVH